MSDMTTTENYCVNGCDRPVELPATICDTCFGLLPPEIIERIDKASGRYDTGNLNTVLDFSEAYDEGLAWLRGASWRNGLTG